MKKTTSTRRLIPFLIAVQSILMSCANYYKVVNPPVENNNQKATAIDSLLQTKRIFILRNGNEAFQINNAAATEQNNIICTLDFLSADNKLHLGLGRKGKLRYKKNVAADKSVLKEVHIYIEPDSTVAVGAYKIPFGRINKIEVIEKDIHKTTSSYILGGLGIGVTAALTAVLIAFASIKGVE